EAAAAPMPLEAPVMTTDFCTVDMWHNLASGSRSAWPDWAACDARKSVRSRPPQTSRVRGAIQAPDQGGWSMSQFLFVYRGGQRADSPAEGERVMQKWVAWMEDLGKKGFLKDRGQPLEQTGKVVRGKDKVVTDGPYAESKDIVGGYTLVEAKDISQA